MKRGWLLNLALFAAVAALGLHAWLTPSREDLAKQPLSTLRPAQAAHITLVRPGKPDIVLERWQSQWRITAPVRARADDFQVMRMLTVLEAQPTARLPATDLSRYDLHPPAARLTVDGTEYAFGGINAVTSEQYVMRGDAVFSVALRHGAGLPAEASALIQRRLLEENEQPVAVTLPDFSVSQVDGRWTLTPPAPADADDLQRYVDLWRHAFAVRAAPYDQRPPVADIRINLRDGRTLAFGVLQREPQLLLWRRDNGLQYQFPATAGRSLLTKPASPPNEITEK